MQDQPSHLFSPLRLRDLTLSNRIAVSPMCQYSAHEGLLNDGHFVHLGSRAVVGAGLILKANIPVGSGYQTRFAEQIRRKTGVATGAVGLITSAAQADHIIRSQQADMVLLAHALLRDPYWALRAAEALRQEISWPVQYQRASRSRPPVRQSYPS